MVKIKMLQTVEDSYKHVEQDAHGSIVTDEKGNPVIKCIVRKYYEGSSYPVPKGLRDKLVGLGYAEDVLA